MNTCLKQAFLSEYCFGQYVPSNETKKALVLRVFVLEGFYFNGFRYLYTDIQKSAGLNGGNKLTVNNLEKQFFENWAMYFESVKFLKCHNTTVWYVLLVHYTCL